MDDEMDVFTCSHCGVVEDWDYVKYFQGRCVCPACLVSLELDLEEQIGQKRARVIVNG